MHLSLLVTACLFTLLASAIPRPIGDPGPGHAILSKRTFYGPFTPGINWEFILRDDGSHTPECTSRQQETLIGLVQTTAEYLAEASTAKETGYAWQQFFLHVNPLKPAAKSNSWFAPGKASDTYTSIRNSIYLASRWAAVGDPDRPHIKARQIALRCYDVKQMCTKNGLQAYTRAKSAGEPPMIVFCDSFWRQPNLNELVDLKHLTWTMNSMLSREHILAHEYMHVDIMGHALKIVDVKEPDLPNIPSSDNGVVYGASRCHDFAWMKVPAGDDPLKSYTKSKVNHMVAKNADNYAWFATAHFLWSRFPGEIDLAKRQDEEEEAATDVNHTPWIIIPESEESSLDFTTSDGEYDTEVDVDVDEPDLISTPNCQYPESGDPGAGLNCATSTLPPPSQTSISATSTPSCGPYTNAINYMREVNQNLNDRGGEQCCSAEVPGCIVAEWSSRGAAVKLCAERKLCVDCARLANYVAGMIGACEEDSRIGGSQNITEAVGLMMVI